MTVVTTKPIYPANAHLTRQVVEIYNSTTNAYEPYTAGNLAVSFAAAADGTSPIAGLTNLPLSAAGVSGTYYRVITSAQLTPLAALSGTVVYQIVSGGTDAAYRVVTPMRVSVPRWAQ
jgi:hypothetical protein